MLSPVHSAHPSHTVSHHVMPASPCSFSVWHFRALGGRCDTLLIPTTCDHRGSNLAQTPITSLKKKSCCLYFFKPAIVWNIWDFFQHLTSITNLLKIRIYSLQKHIHSNYKDFSYSRVSEMQRGYYITCICPKMPCFYRSYGEIIIRVWYVAFWAVEFKIFCVS